MQQLRLIKNSSQLNMFRVIILPIFRSTRLCVTACGIMHPRPTLWVHYTTSCNTQSSALEDARNHRPKNVQLTGIINKPLLLHLVGCLYYLYFIIFFFRLAKHSQFIPLKNVVYFINVTFLVRKIFTFYINYVQLFKCPVPGLKG